MASQVQTAGVQAGCVFKCQRGSRPVGSHEAISQGGNPFSRCQGQGVKKARIASLVVLQCLEQRAVHALAVGGAETAHHVLANAIVVHFQIAVSRDRSRPHQLQAA